LKREVCACGSKLPRSGKLYWIEYYIDGYRKRERISPSKVAAEHRLREVLTLRTEGRYVVKKNPRVRFDQVTRWYLNLPQIRAKKSYDRDVLSVQTLLRHFSGLKIKHLTTTRVEAYKQKRLREKSCRGNLTKPATVNRELACLKHMMNLADAEEIIDHVPFRRIKKLKEDNILNRHLNEKDFRRLLSCCLPHLAPVVLMAYYTAMRKSEILSLTWDNVDLDARVIRLRGSDTKTEEGRTIPLHQEVVDMLQSLPRNSEWVFTLNGKPIKDIKRSFNTACKLAGITNFRFHDLRHTAINNWRLQGHDFIRIMAASGYKTMSVFKRYNYVLERELQELVRPQPRSPKPTGLAFQATLQSL